MPTWLQPYLVNGGIFFAMGSALLWFFKRELKHHEEALAEAKASREELAREVRARNAQLERDMEQRYELCMKEMHQRHMQHDDRMRALEINRVTRADFDELRMSIMATIVHSNERVEQQVRELRTYLMDNPLKRGR